MYGKCLILLACCVAATLAVPLHHEEDLEREKRQLRTPLPPPPKFNFNPPPNPNKRFELTRFDASGSPRQGFDIDAAARAKVWESRNKLNQIHGTGSYSQHLGGRDGNTKPNVGVGISFTRGF